MLSDFVLCVPGPEPGVTCGTWPLPGSRHDVQCEI
jgi:hypothetical protein